MKCFNDLPEYTEGDKSSLHTGGATGSIPVSPTMISSTYAERAEPKVAGFGERWRNMAQRLGRNPGAAFALCSVAVWLAGGCAAEAETSAEVHYAPEENLETIDAALIGAARDTIDMAAYVLTDRTIVEALRAAGARGVAVRVWRDGEMAEKLNGPDAAAALGDAAEVKTKPVGQLMHLKGYCVDGALLRTGSANFSHSGLTAQDNDLVVIRGPGACAGFEAKFERAWGQE